MIHTTINGSRVRWWLRTISDIENVSITLNLGVVSFYTAHMYPSEIAVCSYYKK